MLGASSLKWPGVMSTKYLQSVRSVPALSMHSKTVAVLVKCQLGGGFQLLPVPHGAQHGVELTLAEGLEMHHPAVLLGTDIACFLIEKVIACIIAH